MSLSISGRRDTVGALLSRSVLYAARFADGVMKVGITQNPRMRRYSVGRERRAALESFHVGPCVCIGFKCERKLIERVSAIANPYRSSARSREWFTDVDFGAVCNLVNQVSLRNKPAPADPATAKA